MTRHYEYVAKQDGDTLNAQEWNNLAQDVRDAVTAINSNSIGEGSATTGNVTVGGTDNDSHIYLNSKGNLCIETTAANIPSGKKGKINIEANDDIQLKPGDDIMLYSDHRGADKTDEVSIKVMDGSGSDDVPVKLQINTSEISLTTKDKTGNDANVMDINVVTGEKDQNDKAIKGYLKVRAQAIDLRCENHGGIALQPKGDDGEGNMNKIKFEHGGGDGLEFGTFNSQKTSIYTDEYRFKKNGVWKMATRQTENSDKYDGSDETTRYKYVKQADDFYDIINPDDNTCTTQQIINVAKLFGTLSLETVHIGGYDVPLYYNIIPVTVSDLDDDTDIVDTSWQGPIQTGYRITAAKARIYDLLDTMPTQNDTETFLNNLTVNQRTVVGIDADHVYEITKSDISAEDIFELVSYYKSNNLGPWAIN